MHQGSRGHVLKKSISCKGIFKIHVFAAFAVELDGGIG